MPPALGLVLEELCFFSGEVGRSGAEGFIAGFGADDFVSIGGVGRFICELEADGLFTNSGGLGAVF